MSWASTTPYGRSTAACRATRSCSPRRVMDAVGELEGDVGARELLARFRVRQWEAGHLASATDIDTPDELSRV